MWNLTINEQGTQLSKNKIAMLSYRVAYHTIKLDPDRVQPLLDMPVSTTKKKLQRIIGLLPIMHAGNYNTLTKFGH